MPDSDVSLTLQTILAGQTTMQSDLGALRDNTTRALTRLEVIDTRNKTADALHLDHEARIRGLERFRFTLAGMSIIGGVIAGAIGYWVGHIIH